MFKLLRFYSLMSFVAVLGTALLIGLVYRQVAIQGLMQLAERNNLALARTALNAVKPELVGYLDRYGGEGLVRIGHAPPPPALAEAIVKLMHESAVLRIKIYNRHGTVVFSTKTSQIGSDQRNNAGFRSAIGGRVANTLIYRDTFNAFDEATEEDNLMQTYIPVRSSATEPVEGVFEIYTDVNDLVQQNERTEVIIMAGSFMIMAALYGILLLVVRRARNIIELQHQTIRERTETLEILSSRMLKSEETQKKKIAVELHEGLAQTLSAVKLALEANRKRVADDDTIGRTMAAIIPTLQSAIEDVRTIATELRPSSIDDLGLLPTISAVARAFRQQHPAVQLRQELAVQEKDIPAALKVILYRIVVLALDDIALHSSSDRVTIALSRQGDILTLLVDDTPSTDDASAATLVALGAQSEARFDKMLELVTLSGGSFASARPAAGRILLRATWNAWSAQAH